MTILDRLRSAESGSEQLDILIENALNIGRFKPPHPFRAHIDGSERLPAHPYTTSIDAALALVDKMLPGWFYRVCPKYCELTHPKYRAKDVDGHGATPALAILTAIFTALEAKDTTP